MAIALNGTGSITGVSVGGLPDGIVDTDTLAANAVTSAVLPAGSVLQVAQGTFTTKTTTTSATYVDTGLSVSITPTSSSSKVFIMTSFLFGQTRDPVLTQNNMKSFTLVRDSTDLAPGNSRFFAHQDQASGSINWAEQTQICAINFLDSPSTTSATTYKLQMKTDFSGTEIYFNTRANGNGDHQGSSTIIAMEVAG